MADALARAEARGATASAAVLVGAGFAMIDLAVAHARQREQFGRPIGTFQAVKHHPATALVDVQFALPLVERAAHSTARVVAGRRLGRHRARPTGRPSRTTCCRDAPTTAPRPRDPATPRPTDEDSTPR